MLHWSLEPEKKADLHFKGNQVGKNFLGVQVRSIIVFSSGLHLIARDTPTLGRVICLLSLWIQVLISSKNPSQKHLNKCLTGHPMDNQVDTEN